MSSRRPLSFPSGYGYRLVGEPAEIAVDLGVPVEEIQAITVRLPAWGVNARQQEVWSMAAVRRELGVPEPPRHRGAHQFRFTIPGSRGVRRRRSRQRPAWGAGDPGGLEAASGPQEPREWASGIEEV